VAVPHIKGPVVSEAGVGTDIMEVEAEVVTLAVVVEEPMDTLAVVEAHTIMEQIKPTLQEQTQEQVTLE